MRKQGTDVYSKHSAVVWTVAVLRLIKVPWTLFFHGTAMVSWDTMVCRITTVVRPVIHLVVRTAVSCEGRITVDGSGGY